MHFPAKPTHTFHTIHSVHIMSFTAPAPALAQAATHARSRGRACRDDDAFYLFLQKQKIVLDMTSISGLNVFLTNFFIRLLGVLRNDARLKVAVSLDRSENLQDMQWTSVTASPAVGSLSWMNRKYLSASLFSPSILS